LLFAVAAGGYCRSGGCFARGVTPGERSRKAKD
jgi:hypothetical protein